MSVLDIRKMPERGGQFDDYADTYQTYLIRTDDIEDDFFTIKPAVESEAGAFGSSHPRNPFYTRRNVRLDARTPFHWTAYVQWSTRPISREQRDREQYPNPLDRPLKLRGRSLEFQEYRDEDLDGNAYVNSAGDPLEAQAFESSRVVIPVTLNVPRIESSYFSFNNTVNDSDVTISDGVSTLVLSKEFWQIKGIEFGDVDEENGWTFYQLSAFLHASTNETYKWNLPRIDQGFYYLDSGNRKRFSVKDIDGIDQNAPTERLLDGSGGALGSGNDPHMLTFTDFKTSTWTDLPFFS